MEELANPPIKTWLTSQKHAFHYSDQNENYRDNKHGNTVAFENLNACCPG